jgi:hypothetical protein
MAFLLVTVSCGSDRNIPIKEKDGEGETIKTYKFQQYGLFDTEKRNPKVHYKVVVGNVIWSVILFETVAVPIILIGWYLYEPVGTAIEGEPGAVKS